MGEVREMLERHRAEMQKRLRGWRVSHDHGVYKPAEEQLAIASQHAAICTELRAMIADETDHA